VALHPDPIYLRIPKSGGRRILYGGVAGPHQSFAQECRRQPLRLR
jgi:hypothetical protein